MIEMIQKAKSRVEEMIKRLFQEERQVQIKELISEALKYQPSCFNGTTYRTEMERRHQYLEGAMQRDMDEVLKRRFENTYKDIKDEQLNLKLYKWEISQKAKVFIETGEFYLVDEKGEKVEDQNFADLIDDAKVLLSFKQMDRFTRSMHRSMWKPWWDEDNGHARVNVWPAYLCFIIPSNIPGKEWDVDRARCVMFERQGKDGPADPKKRYEFWAVRDEGATEATGERTLHFISSDEGDYKLNDGDVIPYTDPQNDNRPILPFIWFQDDDETILYKLGDEDALTANRMLNSGLTDMVQILHFQGFGVWIHQQSNTGGAPQALGIKTISPNTIVELLPGDTLECKTPDLNVDTALEFWTKVLDAAAKLENLGTSALRRDDTAPESGRALKIREKPQTDERKDMIGIYQDRVEEGLRRLVIVHNTHCDPAKKIPENLWPRWNPGEPEIPSDPKEETDNAAAEKTLHVSTPVDLRMKRYREDRPTAEQAVLDNAEFNKQLAEISFRPAMTETAFGQFAKKKEEEKEGEDKGEKEEEEGQTEEEGEEGEE